MALRPGHRLGPYEIVAPIGAGGMGEVYRATDAKLKREVAIKVLPDDVAADAERLARFEREAQALAALNHPNIAQIYAVEGSAIVLELVEGEDLAERMKRGPLPLDDALGIARQIADALEAAHERGIVHRDLKPGNVKVKADGAVKVLDFGLAKALDPAPPEAAPTASGADARTTTSPAMTAMGMILGTASYMAPEQARGRPVDKRADIWAFGVVLLEMLTGRSPFAAETVSDVLAAVLTREPDWNALPPPTPPAVRRLLARCLERDPRRRLRDIGDARLELDEESPAIEQTEGPVRSSRGLVGWTIAAMAVAIALWAFSSRSPGERDAFAGHFTIDLPEEAALVVSDIPTWSEGALAVSPDGRQVVYVAPNGRGTQLYARSMDDLTPRALPGTEGARLPFFSPDGAWIGFFAEEKLKKTPLAGGTPATLADAYDGMGADWGENGEIVFAPTYSSGLSSVPEEGGTPRKVTSLDLVAGDDLQAWPQLLADDGAVLFTVLAWSREASEIVLVDLESGERRRVLEDAVFARYFPAAEGAATGHVLFVRQGALMAAPFDPAGSGPAGTPFAVLDGVRGGQFDVSASGVLVYAQGTDPAPDYSLVWVDRAGAVSPINDLPRGYEDLHLSPDGRRVALTIEEAGLVSAAHVWLADTRQGTLTRWTFDGYSRDPVWAPDGRSIVFGSKRDGDAFGLYLQPVDGRSPAELIWSSPIKRWPDPQSWTPDGRTVIFTTSGKETGSDIWTLSLDDRTARPWLEMPGAQWAGRLSPDGEWMAYNSDESGRDEVYVQPFPGPGAKRIVSQNGGYNPIWSKDGSELFYRHGNEFHAVKIDTGSGFTAGKPVVMFEGSYRWSGRDYDVSEDGKRFVMMRNEVPRTTTKINVLLDWWQALETRLAGTRR